MALPGPARDHVLGVRRHVHRPGRRRLRRLTGPLNHRLGLPGGRGNLMTYDAVYTVKTYDQLPAKEGRRLR
ncbi:hypothetical protein [Streptomyces monashensis]|uniref:hypothetical protein n=1 Tax=Streptomyces monashensis TaxID=1678012 RepID=UPI0015A59E42|nr:hypothetical protein [Streptomyces monashensis]